jgi:hypothetical protein
MAKDPNESNCIEEIISKCQWRHWPLLLVGENVVTLALGSQPKQRIARLWAKKETRESYHMLLGVKRVWGSKPSHSQVNSYGGSWSSKWTPKSSKYNYKGQNLMAWSVFYIIEKILKRRCLQCALIAHLDQTQVMAKRRTGNQIANLTSDH